MISQYVRTVIWASLAQNRLKLYGRHGLTGVYIILQDVSFLREGEERERWVGVGVGEERRRETLDGIHKSIFCRHF